MSISASRQKSTECPKEKRNPFHSKDLQTLPDRLLAPIARTVGQKLKKVHFFANRLLPQGV